MHKNIYGTNKTLINNWNEENFDVEFQETSNRPRLVSERDQRWKTVYNTEHVPANSAMDKTVKSSPLFNSSLRPATQIIVGPESQEVTSHLATTKAFPKHQPLVDPLITRVPYKPFETTTSRTYVDPKLIPKSRTRDDSDPIRGIELTDPELLRDYRQRWTKLSKAQKELLTTENQKAYVDHYQQINQRSYNSQTLSPVERLKATGKEAVPDDVACALEKLRQKLKERGTESLKSLSTLFRIMDNNHSISLTREEFQYGLQDNGIQISTKELEILINYFDKQKDSTISFDEFLVAIRGPMNEFRQSYVDKVFSILDTDGTGYVSLEEIRSKYVAKNHPKVISGEMTEEQVYKGFMKNYESTTPDGKITHEEWTDYYTAISASIDRDDYFELLMTSCWKLTN